MVSETHVFTPAFLNEMRAGFGRVSLSANQQNQSNNLNQKVGLPVISANPRDTGLSFISVNGFSPLGDEINNPQHGVTNTYQFIDQASYIRGRSNFDIRHRSSISYSYDLPGKGKLLGGWQTFGILTFQSGQPFTVALLTDFDNSNTGRSNLGFGAGDRPNVVRSAALSNPTVARWFDTSAFVIPARGNFGNAGRNILDGPGYQTVNLSLLKNTTLAERTTLQFRAEFFNLLNRANFGLPDNFAGSASFGQILSAGNPRRVQLGLKLLF